MLMHIHIAGIDLSWMIPVVMCSGMKQQCEDGFTYAFHVQWGYILCVSIAMRQKYVCVFFYCI